MLLVYCSNILKGYLCALAHSLLQKLITKVISTYGIKTWYILNLWRVNYLTSKDRLFYNKDGLSISKSIYCGCESCRTAANYYNIIHYIFS